MMTYNNLDLFSSGPSQVDPGPLEGRDAVADAPGGIGATVITQGTRPRKLTQCGTLVADDFETLQVMMEAIQAQVALGAAALVDQHGKVWPACLMQRFEPHAVVRLGPRVKADYAITYLQAH